MDDAAEDSRWIIQSSRIVYNRTLKGRKVLLGKGAFGKVGLGIAPKNDTAKCQLWAGW